MSRRTTASRRYADAAFELGRADGTLERWEADLVRLREALEHPELRRIVEHPAISYSNKERVLRRVVGRDLLPQAMNLALLMVRRGRPRAIGAMVERFGELLRRHRGVTRAEVRSALPLDSGEREAIATRLQELTGDRVEMTDAVEKALIGGVMVRVGDVLYDASVRSRLERLRARLAAG
jgi:F-type H+-transporting ATPase subunit delta